MPSVSDKQHRFMLAAAHNKAFAKKAGIKQSVARDFTAADKAGGLFGHRPASMTLAGGKRK